MSRVKKSGRVACWPPVLAQRARSEGARWTRAVGAQTGHPPVKRRHASLEGSGLLNARSKGPPWPLPREWNRELGKNTVGRAQWKINQPPSLKR